MTRDRFRIRVRVTVRVRDRHTCMQSMDVRGMQFNGGAFRVRVLRLGC